MIKRKNVPLSLILCLITTMSLGLLVNRCPYQGQNSPLDPEILLKTSGIEGKFSKGVYQVTLKRVNLTSISRGVQLNSEFGLSGWMTLSGTRQKAILLGDIPIREVEIDAILSTVAEAGLRVPALHNRFAIDSQRIFSLHVEGFGSQEAMAKAMGLLLNRLPLIKTPAIEGILARIHPSQSSLTADRMEKLLWKGDIKNGIFQIEVGRSTTLSHHEIGEATGTKSWASFIGTEELAAVDGEIASLENEVPAVLKDLIHENMQITSIHTHFNLEKPRLLFIHFFGVGEVSKLALSVKKAFWEKERFQAQ